MDKDQKKKRKKS